MTEVKHTRECLEQANKRFLAILDYAEEWPNFCRKCGATGELCYQDDPSPAGVALSPGSITMCDPCEGRDSRPCVEQGYCPRCAEKFPTPTWPRDNCPMCRWEAGVTSSAPPLPECLCEAIYDLEPLEDSEAPEF